jgi:hypothetical protein
LDLYGLLTLAAEAYTTYQSVVKVHADAIKANFEGVQESQSSYLSRFLILRLLSSLLRMLPLHQEGAQNEPQCSHWPRHLRVTSGMEPTVEI